LIRLLNIQHVKATTKWRFPLCPFYIVVQKKLDTKLLTISLLNVYQFSHFFAPAHGAGNLR